MKLYRTNAGFHGTQAEAKGFDKNYEQVEVPTDKPGLLAFLNQLDNAQQDREDHYTTVVERQDPPIEDEPGDAPQTLNLQYLQTFFDQAPLTLQGELAVRAIDRLVAAAPKPVAPPATPVDQLREEVASDDDLFQ